MNLLSTIIRTHWAATVSSEEAHHCLTADITTWGRSISSRDSAKYHQLEPLVGQSFTARVTALFYAAMRRMGYVIQPDTETLEITDMISTLTPDQYFDLVEDIRSTAFTLDAWNGKGHQDIEFRTMCRLLQEIELFLTLRYAVKFADIGLLRRLVDPLAVYFFGASQNKYGNEMLYYRWNLSSVNTPELQHAILSSGLVNWHGRPATHKAIDLGLEHLNGSCKIEMKCYKNSTHDVDVIFNRVCLSNTWMGLLRSKYERAFGEEMSGAHTTAETVLDITLVARNIFIGDLAEPRGNDLLSGSIKMFDSFDIMKKGMAQLEERVAAFNNRHVRQPQSVGVSYSTQQTEDEDNGFIDIEEYSAYVTEQVDGITDPIIDLAAVVDHEVTTDMATLDLS